MQPMYTSAVSTPYGEKTISVYLSDILLFDEPIDILTTSARKWSYAPTPNSVFGALFRHGISAADLAAEPEIDLRQLCNVWLSKAVYSRSTMIRRIGCIEMVRYSPDGVQRIVNEQAMLNSIRAYFQMLDIASTYGIPMDTIALPLLGTGDQHISASLTMIPILNECISFLKRNQSVQRICFIERNYGKAGMIMQALQTSYTLSQAKTAPIPTPEPAKATGALAFISYSSPDKNIADNLCAKLERQGVKVWYAPRDVQGPYAAAIADAISRATHFVVILSQNSMHSEHVLNEIDLAFQGLPDKIKFKPLRIDESLFTPSFKYYLSRQHWMDAIIPPLESRLDEFVTKLIADL